MVTVQNASALNPIKTFFFPPPTSENRNKLDDEHDALLDIFNTLGFRIIHFSCEGSLRDCLLAYHQFPAGDMSSNCTGAAPVSASKTKTKKKHFIGQKVKLFRASEPILSVLMWGVNHTVSRP